MSDKDSRFMKRIKLLSMMDKFIREAKYHRDNRESERIEDGVVIWSAPEEEGSGKVN